MKQEPGSLHLKGIDPHSSRKPIHPHNRYDYERNSRFLLLKIHSIHEADLTSDGCSYHGCSSPSCRSQLSDRLAKSQARKMPSARAVLPIWGINDIFLKSHSR